MLAYAHRMLGFGCRNCVRKDVIVAPPFAGGIAHSARKSNVVFVVVSVCVRVYVTSVMSVCVCAWVRA